MSNSVVNFTDEENALRYVDRVLRNKSASIIYVNFGEFEKVPCVPISVLAEMCLRKTNTLRRYETRLILPKANFKIKGPNEHVNKVHGGIKVYTVDLAKKVAVTILTTFKNGTKASTASTTAINKAFQEERLKYS